MQCLFFIVLFKIGSDEFPEKEAVELFDYKDQVAIITGGAQGIGGRCAEVMSQRGAKIVIADYNFENAENKAQALIDAGGEAIAIKVDVSNTDMVNAAVQATLEKWGRIDMMINCAGILLDSDVVSMTDDQWNTMLNIHAGGVFRFCRAVLPAMQKQNYGRIVNISSLSARQTVVRAGANYCAAKGAIVTFSRQLAQQQRSQGYDINVNCVSPGTSRTPMIAKRPPEVLAAMEKLFPLGRLGEVDDLVYAILFMTSPWADRITGETIDINGGKYMM